VRLCVVSMSLSLARRSHICLSMAGSAICRPLLRGISLSSGSGDCLSLLGGMVNSLLCYRKQRIFLGSDTKLTQHAPSGMPAHKIFSFLGPKNTNWSFYFLFGKSSPTELFPRSPLFTYQGIGFRNFARSAIERCTLGSSRPDTSINADLSLTCWDFFYHDFATRDVEHFILPTPDSQYVDYPTCVRVDLSTSRHLYREFRVLNFANPDAMSSPLLVVKLR
jgi:hypothetical protein